MPIPPRLGGAVEKMWFALGKDFIRAGHEVTHISREFNGMPAEEIIDEVHHKRILGYDIPSSSLYLKWLDLLYTIRATRVIPIDSDIIVTNTFWAPIVLSRNFKKRCFVDIARMPKGQMRWYKKVPRLKANSNHVAQAIKREFPLDLHSRVIMIPNPLPIHSMPNVNFNDKKKILLYAGRVNPEKGLEILIKSFKCLKGQWKLKIVGPWEINAGGGGIHYLEKLKSLAGNAEVEFSGPIFDIAILNNVYKQASIFIYPSVAEQGETFGLAVLEAMSWGCVPIVSRLSCFQDFIKDECNGLIFDHRDREAVNLLTDAIIRLQQDDLFRYTLAEQALKVRETHSSSFIASLLLEEFKKMLHELEINRY